MSPFECQLSYFMELIVRFLVVSACSNSEDVLRLAMELVHWILSVTRNLPLGYLG